jgi:TPR repeat protein
MRWRADQFICIVVAIVTGIVSLVPSARADAQSQPAEAALQRAAGTANDIVRMPPPRPLATAPHGSLIKVSVTVGSLPTDTQKGWVGVVFDPLDPPLATALGLKDANGALVLGTTPGGPASRAGLRLGDVVVAFDGTAAQNVSDLRQLLLSASPGRTAVLDVWRVAANDGDFLEILRRAAERGDPQIMYRLGRIFVGAMHDDAAAVEWYRRAAAAGYSDAETALAIMVLEGRGTTKDIQEALRLLRAAADKNNVDAIYNLGLVLHEGKIVSKDELQAAQLFMKGADLGHVPSMVQIGVMYFNGVGVQADHGKAVAWFKRAAALGNPHAMVNLGLTYVKGEGVEMDFIKAAMWFKRAADLGHSGGMVDLGLLHAQGKGVERNDAAAVALYRSAVSSGNVAGMVNLAGMLDAGLGVERKDPEQAADLIMQSLDRCNEPAKLQMTQNYRSWSKEFRQALQRRLRAAGFNPGASDGRFRASTFASINAYFCRNH